MSLAAVQQLIERWEQDEQFRNQLQQDPEAAVQQANINLEPEELEALKSVDLETAAKAVRYVRGSGLTAA
jgi:predicted DNA-binding protein (UPF0251 family)